MKNTTTKILQLNVWGGRIKGPLLNFFKQEKFDVICLQEAVWSPDQAMLEVFSVTADQIKELSGLNYESRVANWSVKAFNSEVYQGNIILSREEITNEQIETIYGEDQIADSASKLLDHCYKAQLVELKNGLNILNYHGYWIPDPIGDENTVSAMQKVAKLARDVSGPLIMCGDLNVAHFSPAMRELDFLQDLTDKTHVDNTLSGLNFNGQVACDHILVNEHVNVIDFKPLDNLVSDHKALITEVRSKS